MTFTDDGIEQLQTKGIRNSAAETPTNLSFAGSDNTITGSMSGLTNEWIRKTTSWTATGINSKYLVQLASTEAIGSYIGTLGLFGGATIGSDVLFTANTSFIGEKTSAFNIQVEGEIIIKRA